MRQGGLSSTEAKWHGTARICTTKILYLPKQVAVTKLFAALAHVNSQTVPGN